jgi:hypothetical protein
VNGLTLQNGVTTNLLSAKTATGEEVPEQVTHCDAFLCQNDFAVAKQNWKLFKIWVARPK